MKKICVLFLVLSFTLSSLQAQFKHDGINYEVVSNFLGTAQVGSNNELSGDIVIPSTVTDPDTGTSYTVVAVKGYAFAQPESSTISISSITLPDTVKNIANDAFAQCDLLTTSILFSCY